MTENGKKQHLAIFAPQGPDFDSAPVAGGSGPGRYLNHRLITLLLDFTGTPVNEWYRIQDEATDFIRHDLKPGELLSIETVFWDSIETTQDFTNDQSALLAAVSKFRDRGNSDNPDDAFVSSMVGSSLVIPGVPAAHGALARIAAACERAPIAMKKSLLYFSTVQADADDRAVLSAAANVCTRSGVAIYPIGSASGSVAELAARTGGQTFADRNAAITEARAKARAYYVLGYYSPDSKEDGKYRKVELKLTHPGLQPTALDYLLHGYFGELPQPLQFPPPVCFWN